MPTTINCCYQGHACDSRAVQFISRYRNQNDYCVGGKRVTVYDDGSVREGAIEDDKLRILLFELDKYAKYCRWNQEQRSRYANFPGLTPFEHPFQVAS